MARWIRPETRQAVVERGHHTCCYCGRTGLHLADPETCHSDAVATLDHVVPRAAGGSNAPTNLVVACLSCNSSRQDTPLAQWARKLADQDAARLLPAPEQATARELLASELAAAIIRRVRNETRRTVKRAA